jgi:pimeloyl-ACP methyl ester carboxylesterase
MAQLQEVIGQRWVATLLMAGILAAATSAAGTRQAVLNDQYVTVNGVRLHYVSAGNGPLILFLHGFPEFWYAWKNQLAEFGKDRLAVAPDLRGYNLSDKPAEVDQYRVSTLVEDIRGLAEHFSHDKKFSLVGHDWGGVVAWSFAIAHPEYLEKLVIVNAPHPGIFGRLLAADPEQQTASQYMLRFRQPQAEATLSDGNYSRLVNGVLSAGLANGTFTEDDKAAYLKAWSQPGALTGGLNYYRANRVGPPAPGRGTDPDALPAPAANVAVNASALTVKVPTLVIWGEKDTALLTKNLDGLEQFVPQLTIKRVPDGSHWVISRKTCRGQRLHPRLHPLNGVLSFSRGRAVQSPLIGCRRLAVYQMREVFFHVAVHVRARTVDVGARRSPRSFQAGPRRDGSRCSAGSGCSDLSSRRSRRPRPASWRSRVRRPASRRRRGRRVSGVAS